MATEAFLHDITAQTREAMESLLSQAKCKPGDLVVVGCSSSEVLGSKIGTASSPEVAQAILDGLLPVLSQHGLRLAAQCCEHLNRALIVERSTADAFGYEAVNVVPQPKAGGSFATAAYHTFSDPVAVEHVRARAGLDIGGTLIGMHLAHVAVPVRLSRRQIGEAIVLAARVRPKFVGGSRAVYDEALL